MNTPHDTIEHLVQASVHTYQRGHLPNGEQRSVDVGACTAASVVAQDQSLVWHSEDDIDAEHVTGQPNRVHLRSGDAGTPGLARSMRLLRGNGDQRVTHLRQA